MKSTVALYGVALVVLLGLAFWSWKSEEVPADLEKKPLILDIERKDIQSIVYKSETLTLRVEPKEDELGAYLWGSSERTVKRPKKSDVQKARQAMERDLKKKAALQERKIEAANKKTARSKKDDGKKDDGKGDAKKDDAASKDGVGKDGAKKDGASKDGAAATKEQPASGPSSRAEQAMEQAVSIVYLAGNNAHRVALKEQSKREPKEMITELKKSRFKIGEAGEKVMKELAPFRALRELEIKDDKKLADLGLKEPEATLTFNLKGKQPRVFSLGGEGYGHRNTYLRDEKTGKVYMVEASAVRPLKYGDSRLPERDLLGLKREEIEQISIGAGERSVRLGQFNRDDPSAAYWAAKEGDKPHPAAAAWMEKLFKLSGAGYVDEEEAAGAQPALSVDLKGDEGKPIKLVLLKKKGEDGKFDWYAKSANLRGTVKVFRRLAQDVVTDLDALFTAP